MNQFNGHIHGTPKQPQGREQWWSSKFNEQGLDSGVVVIPDLNRSIAPLSTHEYLPKTIIQESNLLTKESPPISKLFTLSPSPVKFYDESKAIIKAWHRYLCRFTHVTCTISSSPMAIKRIIAVNSAWIASTTYSELDLSVRSTLYKWCMLVVL